MLNKRIAIWCQFHQRVTHAFYIQKIGAKNSKPKSKWKKAAQRLMYEKFAGKMMKLTAGRKTSVTRNYHVICQRGFMFYPLLPSAPILGFEEDNK